MPVNGRGLYIWNGTDFVKTGKLVDDTDPVTPIDFVFGTTEPFNDSPLSPKTTANVGWDGSTLGGTFNTTTLTVPANTTWSNRVINGNVNLTDSTSVLENCLITGGPFATNRSGIVLAPNGGVIRRCTISGTSTSANYWVNGVKHTGGTLTLERNVIQRVVDCVNSTGTTNKIISRGNLYGHYALFTNDADHASDAVRPYWTHNDAIQILSGVGPHLIYGDKIEAYFDTAGVTWSGGAWGSGTASGGVVGMPSDGLNAGYWNNFHQLGTWANGITFSNSSAGYIVTIEKCWIDGVSATSGMIQFTSATGTNHQITLKGNRFGLGGKPSGSGRIYLISYQSGNTVTIGTGVDANIFGNYSSVAASLKGDPLVFTAGGSSIIPPAV